MPEAAGTRQRNGRIVLAVAAAVFGMAIAMLVWIGRDDSPSTLRELCASYDSLGETIVKAGPILPNTVFWSTKDLGDVALRFGSPRVQAAGRTLVSLGSGDSMSLDDLDAATAVIAETCSKPPVVLNGATFGGAGLPPMKGGSDEEAASGDTSSAGAAEVEPASTRQIEVAREFIADWRAGELDDSTDIASDEAIEAALRLPPPDVPDDIGGACYSSPSGVGYCELVTESREGGRGQIINIEISATGDGGVVVEHVAFGGDAG